MSGREEISEDVLGLISLIASQYSTESVASLGQSPPVKILGGPDTTMGWMECKILLSRKTNMLELQSSHLWNIN